eukprot:TRINITY_DN6257_c0_g1_i1.p1 TRINITY_DN6257_c0_g1~~TRINITY_DN6257_c0_g1_i1.p1  ORF type:complete len:525 (+),score=85.66 TRINITY_DN6257_c0_g1_i1:94-1668(+)
MYFMNASGMGREDETEQYSIFEKHHSRLRVRRRLGTMALYGLIVLMYIFFGGTMMYFIESNTEKEGIHELLLALEELNATRNELVQELTNLGVCNLDVQPKWTYSGSIFYALTTVTTIGYGGIKPIEPIGRAFSAFYTIFGISLVMGILSRVAELLMEVAAGAIAFFAEKRLQIQQKISKSGNLTEEAQKQAQDAFDRHDIECSGRLDSAQFRKYLIKLNDGMPVEKNVAKKVMEQVTDTEHITRSDMPKAVAIFYKMNSSLPSSVAWRQLLGAALTVVVWMCSWSCAFSFFEEWSYNDSVWFSIITLTTVGLGDFEPQTSKGRMAAFVFVYFGLGLVGWLISSLAQAFKVKKYWLCTKAYEKGMLSEKIMDVQGIKVAKRRPSVPLTPPLSNASLVPGSQSLQAVPTIPMFGRDSLTPPPRKDSASTCPGMSGVRRGSESNSIMVNAISGPSLASLQSLPSGISVNPMSPHLVDPTISFQNMASSPLCPKSQLFSSPQQSPPDSKKPPPKELAIPLLNESILL